MIKVCIITNIPSPYLVEFFNYISKNSKLIDLQVIYLLPSFNNRRWNMPIIKHNNIIYNIKLNFNLIKIFRQLKDKNTIYFVDYGSLAYQLIIFYFIVTRKRWVMWAEKPKMNNFILKKIIFIFLRNAKAIIGIGSYATRFYGELISIPTYNLPYAIDLERYLKIDRSTRNKNEKIKFLYCGSFVYRKGLDTLITAFKKLRNKYENIEILFVGDGYLKDDILKKLVNYQHIESFKFFDFVQYDNLHEYYSMSDVFVFPTRYDGWGVVINEAMASGMPVITTYDCGASFDLILEGYNGFLCPKNNVECFINKMEYFIINKKSIDYMGKNARKTIKNLLSLPKVLKKFEYIMKEIYENIK
jgi:glycosyltransferase involved in cell wall biosynthesis